VAIHNFDSGLSTVHLPRIQRLPFTASSPVSNSGPPIRRHLPGDGFGYRPEISFAPNTTEVEIQNPILAVTGAVTIGRVLVVVLLLGGGLGRLFAVATALLLLLRFFYNSCSHFGLLCRSFGQARRDVYGHPAGPSFVIVVSPWSGASSGTLP